MTKAYCRPGYGPTKHWRAIDIQRSEVFAPPRVGGRQRRDRRIDGALSVASARSGPLGEMLKGQ